MKSNHPTFLLSRLLLFYVTHATYPRLSRNILREICSYLGNKTLLVSIINTQVYGFVPGSMQWEVCMTLSRPLRNSSRCSYVFLREKLMVIGGYDDEKETTLKKTYEIENGAISAAADLLFPRCFTGTLQTAGTIYLFGGLDNKPLSSCERLDPSTWSLLPSMKHPRFNCIPCEYKGIVYIAGSANNQVETFNVRTEMFGVAEFQFEQMVNRWSCALVTDEDRLYFLGYSWVQQLGYPGHNCKGTFTWSSCAPLVLAGVVYFIDNRSPDTPICRGLRLSDGSRTCSVALST